MSILLRGPPVERERLLRWLAASGEDQITVTIITFEEQMRGWMAVIAKARTPKAQVLGYARLQALLQDYQQIPVLELSDAAAERYAELRRQYRRHGSPDLKIAAITMVAGARLLTRNLRDFVDIEGLDVNNPLPI
jgi:tRNA(fMet)-specific endonuclease VapC